MKSFWITSFYYTSNCVGTWVTYRSLSSIGGMYTFAAVKKMQKGNKGKVTGEETQDYMAVVFKLHLPSRAKHQVVYQLCVSAWHTTTHAKHTHPTRISPSKHWIFNASSINLDSNFTPRAISRFWVGLCSTLQTTLRVTCRVLLIIVPAQSILIQSGQTTKWLWGVSVTRCHSWAHWMLQNCPMESLLKSDATSNAGTGRQRHVMGKPCQTD